MGGGPHDKFTFPGVNNVTEWELSYTIFEKVGRIALEAAIIQ